MFTSTELILIFFNKLSSAFDNSTTNFSNALTLSALSCRTNWARNFILSVPVLI